MSIAALAAQKTAAPAAAGPAVAAAAPEATPPTGTPWPSRSATAEGTHIVADRTTRAAELGTRLGDLLDDPAAFAAAMSAGFAELADPAYHAGQAFVAPGIGPTHGVRTPLQAALRRAFRRSTRRASSAQLLYVADRLLHEPEREARWFAISTLERTIAREPERTWQLLRRAARDADDWITVDTLAHPFGKGILAEPYRWAELEQLTISPSRWERRLVGSTIATMPFVDRTAGRTPAIAARGLAILATLIGDAEPDVQRALAWAYRSMAIVDGTATTDALQAEARSAAANGDGHRAWVIRDSLPKLDPDVAASIREQLAGIRRASGAPATSMAAALGEQFAAMGLGRPMPEPPLT